MTERGLTYSQGVGGGSVSTIISIVPFPILETKPGLFPGEFPLGASKNEEPDCLVIGDSVYYVYIDADRGSLRVPSPSYEVAKSVCFDYLNSQLEAKPECHPGIWWKEGRWTPARVKTELAEELAYYKRVQYTWFVELVKRADDDWEKTRSHYAISDIQRHALRSIDPKNTKNRPWLIAGERTEVVVESMQRCPACGSEVLATAVICRHCRGILNKEAYAKMSFASMDLGDVVR